jgi:hypothetical protein
MRGSLDMSRARDRVQAVVMAAGRVADPNDELGRRARAVLPSVTGLSREGVELGLTRHLETAVSDAELELLLERSCSARRVHVVLSANVFVAAARAIALAVAASDDVRVRASSREPVMAELLACALLGGPAAVTLVQARELAASAGDELHVYGRRQTIEAIAATSDDLSQAARDLSWDVIAFDQRGCLSPRLVFIDGSPQEAERFAGQLADELDTRARDVPRGRLQDDELAGQVWYRRAMQATGSWHEGASYAVGCDVEGRALILPPTGRCVHVVRVDQPELMRALVSPLCTSLTCIGTASAGEIFSTLRALAPAARVSALGQMQRPPLDGPVDLRGMV